MNSIGLRHARSWSGISGRRNNSASASLFCSVVDRKTEIHITIVALSGRRGERFVRESVSYSTAATTISKAAELSLSPARKSLIGSAAEAQNAALLVHDRFIQKSRLTSTRFRNLSRGESGRGGPGARGDLRVHTFSRSDSRPGAPPARLNSPVALWRVREYLIAYAPEEQPLLVIAILHGRRSRRVMAAILRGR